MDEPDSSLSAKAKEFLTRKLEELQKKVIKLKRKRKIVKILYYSSIILSVTLSGLLSALAGLSMLPVYIIPILSTTSGILTALSAKFNLQNKKIEINRAIDKISKIQVNLDYIISCNGDFTKEDYDKLISEMSIL
jgi:hypothetical protein